MNSTDNVVDQDVRDSASGTDGGRATTGTAKRGAGRRTAICQAVYELLGKVGYDRMTMDAVATQAKASKATIYRMWPDKPEMVADSLTCVFAQHADTVPDTGSLRGDLIALMDTACEATNSDAGEVVAGVMTAAARDRRLGEVINDSLFKSKSMLHEAIVRNAAERGEIPADTDPRLLHEVMHSMLTGRKLWNLGPLDEEFAVHVVDDVLIPVLTYRKP